MTIKKKRKSEYPATWFFAIILVVVGILLFFFFGRKTQSPQTSYQSPNLKFAIVLPEKFEINERSIGIDLITQEGDITISRSGTNYENLDDYLDSLIEKNRVEVLSKEYVNINGLKGIKEMGSLYKFYKQ